MSAMNMELIDYSPPAGDYVRYIDELMELASQGEAVAKAPPQLVNTVQAAPPGAVAKTRPKLRASRKFSVTLPTTAAPGQAPALSANAGPPDLDELWSRLIGKSASAGASADLPKGWKWWSWAAVAIVVAGVLFPIALVPLAIVAYVAWRVAKATATGTTATGTKERKS